MPILEWKVIITFLKNLTDVKLHLNNLVDLYLHPIQTYKKAITNRKTSFNFVFYHFIYYLVIALLFIHQDTSWPKFFVIVFVDLILVVIPFVFLLPPFLYFTKRYGLTIKPNRLFRLMLIIKVQIINIGLLLFVFAYWSAVNKTFMIAFNLLGFLYLLWYFVPPLLMLKGKPIVQVAWIFSNFIFLNLFFIAVTSAIYALPKDKGQRIFSRLMIKSPEMEYLKLDFKTNNFAFKILPKYYIYSAKHDSVTGYSKVAMHLPTYNLVTAFNNENYNTALRTLAALEPAKYKHYKDSLQPNGLTLHMLDSATLEDTREFYEDRQLCRMNADSAYYRENELYYLYQNLYLNNIFLTHMIFDSVQKFELRSKRQSINFDKSQRSVYMFEYEQPEDLVWEKKFFTQDGIVEERFMKSFFFMFIAMAPTIGVSYLLP